MQSEIEATLINLARETHQSLPNDTAATVIELAQAGEWGIALEILCEQLFEYDISISRAARDRIAALGGQMGLDSTLWADLRCV